MKGCLLANELPGDVYKRQAKSLYDGRSKTPDGSSTGGMAGYGAGMPLYLSLIHVFERIAASRMEGDVAHFDDVEDPGKPGDNRDLELSLIHI